MKKFLMSLLLFSFVALQIHGVLHSTDIGHDNSNGEGKAHDCVVCEVQSNSLSTPVDSVKIDFAIPKEIFISLEAQIKSPTGKVYSYTSPRGPPVLS